jgi:hypothetical protein
MEGLPDRGAPAVQDHDVADARIHPTLPDPCSALMPGTENLHGSGHGQLPRFADFGAVIVTV